ncbi:PilZ domain-containing protein [Sphingomicrobium sediminis]|uniref:PilZ domain-containing protein n=1 Tax=Sphingomicrobium sediminis TaxID=2950949 RepID=A0A9X2EIU5_9SPHN|nr:PilZ domain-containing protein [Sphingomicrobium sediminis]MCM8558305.1 PilZ domain-containing protein [Sphingomicrobium sediminis]
MVKARIAPVDPAHERRRAKRHDIDLDAQVREMGAEGHEARLLNISDHGFMAEVTEGDYEVGARIWLLLPDGNRASALIKWTSGVNLGAEFAEPVDAKSIALD